MQVNITKRKKYYPPQCPMLKIGWRKKNTHIDICHYGCIWGRLWLLVVNCARVIVRGYRYYILQINFHTYYILHYYYYNSKTMYYLLYFFCLAHHLMCRPSTSDNSFKPVEKPSGPFQS